MTTQQPKQLSPLARFEKTIVATDASPFSADAVKVAIVGIDFDQPAKVCGVSTLDGFDQPSRL